MPYKQVLTTLTARQLDESKQRGRRGQRGQGLGTILAPIGIPMLLNALTSKGAPRMGRQGGAALRIGQSPLALAGGAAPRIGAPPLYGRGKTKKSNGSKRSKGKRYPVRREQPIQQHSNTRGHPLGASPYTPVG